MLSLRSCCHTLSHTTTSITTTLSHSKLSLSSISKQFLKISIKHSTNMSSSRPSAFDALMSNARAAAAKNKTTSSSSSPKKRKTLTLDSKSPINSTSITESKPSETLNPTRIEPETREFNEPKPDKQNPDSVNSEDETKGLKKQKVKVINVDESVVELRKKPVKFDPKKAAYWVGGERVPFLFLVRVFDEISKESGRIVITEIVCNMLRTVIETTPDDLVAVVYLLANRIAPAHEGLELGIGDASIIKALAEACGAKEAHIKKQYKELGDLGLVAKASRSSQPLMRKPQPLTVAKVFDTFKVIAKESGKDSQDKKKNHIKGLLVAATDCEPQYLIRLLQTKLRIGLAEQTLLTALGHAIVYTEKHPSSRTDSPLEEAAKIVKQVYSVIPVYDKIVPALLSGGVWDLPKTCCFSPGVPVGPMLAKPTKGVSEILDKFQNMEFTCEYKYDGERAQIHYLEDGTVQIYSRNAERNTEKFPDVVVAASRVKKPNVTSYVLDCELVAYDRKKQKILPFQILSTRARKNVVMSEIKVDVCIYAFDLLYLNGQQLLQEQLITRRERLYESFEEEPGYFQLATAITSNDLEEIQTFLDTAVNASCEGLIIKTLTRDATYEPAKRSNNWLKLKKDYMDSIGDSLDLVPIAAFHGRGKRVGGYGAFLLACYDNNKDEYQTICKIGTGFSEAMLEERSTSLRSKVIPKPKSYYRYADSINPDVWFEASEVWEVKAADLTISPVYCAAIGEVDPNKGISLRFPRLLRVREDKGPEEASSSEMVADMYNAQKHTQSNNQDDEDE
ncbi:putative DNA ligase (ATP) [Helianthus annuus]|uniref:DNA ligase n=1 Tax=Helianthus annuus TaxID=4232 RepID=A0A251TCF9_HELAN|nr:DNA ligase 1 [Helianthus annuus]KAF5783588.1 putative DNA ligase (ATP) [Helianthus annuus]KAJ0518841.1 putative DNA ligase (ATP) [Helianthus annuus]KAJ0817535.1 putative DNA ligase (ATP) [Helianthus annuus]KAJ0876654.1 putative DNA ligase (ATP) [Helianthus annuus]